VLLGLGGIWGASFLFIKVVVDETGPLELVLGRLFFGMLALGGYVAWRRLPLAFDLRLLGAVSIWSVISNIIPFALIGWGEERIDTGVASVLNSTMPIFTSILAAALLMEERFTTARLAGLALGFAGVAVLFGDDILHITESSAVGQLAVVLAAACYAVGAIFARNLLRGREPVGLTLLLLVMGTFWTAPLLLAVEGTPDYSLSLEATLSLLALGVFGTGLGSAAYVWLIEAAGTVRASIVTYIIPAVGLFLGWVVLDEEIGLNIIAGGALIAVGVAAVLRTQSPAQPAAQSIAPAPVGENESAPA